MKFEELIKHLNEADITAQQFTDALGDEDDRAKVKADIIKKKFLDKWEEYVREAEHQDGYGYWNNFNTLEELVDDFKLYVRIKDSKNETH